MRFLIRLVVAAAALWVAAAVVNGVDVNEHGWRLVLTLLGVALVFGVVNAVVKPVLTLLALPAIILTLGLVLLVVNGLLLELTSWLARKAHLDFEVHGFGAAVLGALIVSVVSWALGMMLPD